jgi:hypothetical protein
MTIAPLVVRTPRGVNDDSVVQRSDIHDWHARLALVNGMPGLWLAAPHLCSLTEDTFAETPCAEETRARRRLQDDACEKER